MLYPIGHEFQPENYPLMQEGYISYGNEAVAWVQSFRSDVLDSVFKTISYVADAELLIIIAACIYWIIEKRVGFSLMLLFLFGSYLNLAVKGLLEIPRPSGPEIKQLSLFTGYSLPSAHAQNATTFGLITARTFRNQLFGIFTIILVLSIGLSRVYMGAHYPTDVVLGILAGIALVATYSYLLRFLESRITKLSFSKQILIVVTTMTPCFFGAPTPKAAVAVMMLSSFSIGWIFENRYLHSASLGTFKARSLQVLIGITGLGLIVLLGRLLEFLPGHDLLIATALGFWITLGAPSLFLISGIAEHRTLAISS